MEKEKVGSFIDADWTGCADDRRLYTGFGFLVGSEVSKAIWTFKYVIRIYESVS